MYYKRQHRIGIRDKRSGMQILQFGGADFRGFDVVALREVGKEVAAQLGNGKSAQEAKDFANTKLGFSRALVHGIRINDATTFHCMSMQLFSPSSSRHTLSIVPGCASGHHALADDCSFTVVHAFSTHAITSQEALEAHGTIAAQGSILSPCVCTNPEHAETKHLQSETC